MTYKTLQSSIYILAISLFISCRQGPKIISTPIDKDGTSTTTATGIFSDEKSDAIITTRPNNPSTNDLHKVTVLEVLPTERYVYLNVEENDDKYWIATAKKAVAVGEIYYYKNGILKTNFESKEHNRIFEKVFLVSNIVAADHGNSTAVDINPNQAELRESSPINVVVKGSVKIGDIIDNPKHYEGQTVQISGICTKLNANIMGRNWIHLKDGSRDDYDFVITSEQPIPEGHQITMTGDVVLEKDFGAGYKYALILENGRLVDSK